MPLAQIPIPLQDITWQENALIGPFVAPPGWPITDPMEIPFRPTNLEEYLIAKQRTSLPGGVLNRVQSYLPTSLQPTAWQMSYMGSNAGTVLPSGNLNEVVNQLTKGTQAKWTVADKILTGLAIAGPSAVILASLFAKPKYVKPPNQQQIQIIPPYQAIPAGSTLYIPSADVAEITKQAGIPTLPAPMVDWVTYAWYGGIGLGVVFLGVLIYRTFK